MLCLKEGKPHLGQERACSTENLDPQPHENGWAASCTLEPEHRGMLPCEVQSHNYILQWAVKYARMRPLSPGQGSWIASGSVGEIRSGIQRAVSIVLVSECVPQVLLLTGGQLLRLSSCTHAVESTGPVIWWRRGTQCQWKRWGWPMPCLQVWLAGPGAYAQSRLGVV